MLLVVDIGNTHITLGVFDKEKLTVDWRLTSAVSRTADECLIMIKMLCQLENLEVDAITGCAISSVVPDQTPVFTAMVRDELQIPCVMVNADLQTGIKILYDDPYSVGADRICNAVAGFHKYGGPLVIIDFGTATTFDIVSKKGEYLGGVIAPGIESSSFVLHQHAARLPKIELSFPKSVIGKTTEASMQAGIMYGTVELVNGIIRRINQELEQRAKLIATGGIAIAVFEKLQDVPQFEPHLILEGLRLIYDITKARG
ncbi:type III pantothenate kinase [bacterium]|nr:type III pantothenate kinase [bacterium]